MITTKTELCTRSSIWEPRDWWTDEKQEGTPQKSKNYWKSYFEGFQSTLQTSLALTSCQRTEKREKFWDR